MSKYYVKSAKTKMSLTGSKRKVNLNFTDECCAKLSHICLVEDRTASSIVEELILKLFKEFNNRHDT